MILHWVGLSTYIKQVHNDVVVKAGLHWSNKKSAGHDIYFYNQKFGSGVNKGLGWFSINLMCSLQNIIQGYTK